MNIQQFLMSLPYRKKILKASELIHNDPTFQFKNVEREKLKNDVTDLIADREKDPAWQFMQEVLSLDEPQVKRTMDNLHKAFNNAQSLKAGIGPTGVSLHTKELEKWINDMLKDAEDLNMKGIMKYPVKQKPINRYNSDRMALMKKGLTYEQVDRLYSAMYVHSVGFFQAIKDCTRSAREDKDTIVVNIWRIFQILLEHTCPTDYKLITQVLEAQHTSEIQKITDELKQINQKETEKEKEYYGKIYEIRKEAEKATSDKFVVEKECEFLVQELNKTRKK